METKWRHLMMRFLMKTVVLVAFMMAGGFVFYTMENASVSDRNKLAIKKRTFANVTFNAIKARMESHWNITISRKIFLEFANDIKAVELPTDEPKLSFADGFALSWTIVSTIGYGILVPSTDASKAFFIVYSFIGIPICLLALANAGELITAIVNGSIRFIKPRLKPMSGVKVTGREIAAVHSILVVVYISSFAFVVQANEGWRYFDCVYFLVVSYTTVGFGDFAFGPEHGKVASVGLTVVQLMGLAIVASCINVSLHIFAREQSLSPEQPAEPVELNGNLDAAASQKL